MASKSFDSTGDLALRRRGGLHRADGNRRVGRTITARRKLAMREVSGRRDAFPLYTRGRNRSRSPATRTWRNRWRQGTVHARAERLLGAALAEQHRSRERYDDAVGRSAHLVAAAALHAADQEVAARDAWLRWVDDDRYRGLNAGPFELLAEGSGECGRS
jgi:hypothetical protein